MSRQARIFALLEAARSVPADDLATELAVSRRTVATEVAGLQELLGTAAAIEMVEGRYRLMVADPERYRAVRTSVDDDASFNSPEVRVSYIIARLFRANVPVTTEALAAGMAVGRTTVVSDLARVRQLLAGDDLAVAGRPNAGLTIEGPELQQRLHVLRHHFPMAYPADEQLQARVEPIVRARTREAGLDPIYAPELTRWATVAVDRTRTAHELEYLPVRYSGLSATPAHGLASSLADGLGSALGTELSAAERIFLTLPIAGMRAPGDAEVAERLSGGADTDTLVGDVLAAVRSEMEINLAGAGFLSEFARHVAYMLNRMRYRIWVDDTHVADVRSEFPVAYRMAKVAARVIEQRVGLPVDDAELGFLATYFQVFLEGRQRPMGHLRVVILATTGMVSAELVRLQLSRVLPGSTQFETMTRTEATQSVLADADLVVVAGDADVATRAPVLHVTRVLDKGAMLRQLERLQLRVPVGLPEGQRASVLGGALDDRHFFALPAGTSYADAVDFMTGHLEARGLVEQGFGSLIREREARAQTQLDPWVGFPHATFRTQATVALAVGVIPRAVDDDGARLIVLLGVPAGSDHSEEVLVQVYDEVLRLGARRDLLQQLSHLKTFEEFYYFLEKNPTTER